MHDRFSWRSTLNWESNEDQVSLRQHKRFFRSFNGAQEVSPPQFVSVPNVYW